MLQLSRRALPCRRSAVRAARVRRAGVQAMPPEVTLTSPVRAPGGQPAVVRGHRRERWSGRAARSPSTSTRATVVGDKPLAVANAVARPRDRRLQRHARRRRCPTAPTPPARASATPSRRRATRRRSCSRSAPRRRPRRPRRPRPHPRRSPPSRTPTPTPAPAVVAPATTRRRRTSARAAATSPSTSSAPTGTKLRVVATINGRALKSTSARKEIRIRVDLRGEPKDTYTLRVAITRTRDGKRITTVAVEQIDYHTCA